MKILAINFPNLDLSYFTSRGLSIEVTHVTVKEEKFPYKFLFNRTDQTGQLRAIYCPIPTDYLNKTYKNYEYSIILVGCSPVDYGLGMTGGYTESVALNCGSIWSVVRQDSIYGNGYAVHELHHALALVLNVTLGLNKANWTMIRDYMDVDSQGRPYYLNDQPNNPLSNHAQTWNQIFPHISKLQAITYTSPMQPVYKPANFTLQELVPQSIFNQLGDLAWQFMDTRVLKNIQYIREKTGLPITINKYSTGLQNRGYDPKKAYGGYRETNSQHTMGRALDFNIGNWTTQQAHAWIKANYKNFPEPCITLENPTDTPTWTHMDVRYRDYDGSILFVAAS